jgi:hypothetical protein
MTLCSSTIASAQSPRSLTLVLVVGEMSGPPVSDDVPMSARKALDELRSLLPFKSYRLYDTGVIGMPSETLPAVTRLRGASVRGQEPPLFEVSVMRPKFSQSLDVSLREVGSGEAPKPVAAESAAANVMAASVRVNAGETVVVGASRVRGDKALVLLITGMASSLGASESSRTPARPAPSVAPFNRLFNGEPPQPAQPPQPPQQPQPGQPSAQPPQPTPQPPRPQAVQPVPFVPLPPAAPLAPVAPKAAPVPVVPASPAPPQ